MSSYEYSWSKGKMESLNKEIEDKRRTKLKILDCKIQQLKQTNKQTTQWMGLTEEWRGQMKEPVNLKIEP